MSVLPRCITPNEPADYSCLCSDSSSTLCAFINGNIVNITHAQTCTGDH
jgi:hypothetical protein